MRIKNKKIYKISRPECCICQEDNLSVLDVHRIHEGKNGGSYDSRNCVVCCSNCHRKIHAGEIKIVRKHPTLSHRYYIEVVASGETKFIEVPY